LSPTADQKRINAIAAEDYKKNLDDADTLFRLAQSFWVDANNGNLVLSVDSLKKLNDMQKITRRIQGRAKHPGTTF
jgi:hypothetical protein